MCVLCVLVGGVAFGCFRGIQQTTLLDPSHLVGMRWECVALEALTVGYGGSYVPRCNAG
jgi:hypothetical protein